MRLESFWDQQGKVDNFIVSSKQQTNSGVLKQVGTVRLSIGEEQGMDRESNGGKREEGRNQGETHTYVQSPSTKSRPTPHHPPADPRNASIRLLSSDHAPHHPWPMHAFLQGTSVSLSIQIQNYTDLVIFFPQIKHGFNDFPLF